MKRTFLTAVIALGCGLSGLALAQDGGYEGLMAPPSASSSGGSESGDGGYDGLMAAPPTGNYRTQRDEPEGYTGLIPGAAPKPKKTAAPKPAPDQNTAPDNLANSRFPDGRPKANDLTLRTQSANYGREKDGAENRRQAARLPDHLLKSINARAPTPPDSPYSRENLVKKQIENLQAAVDNPALSPEQRRTATQKMLDSLKTMRFVFEKNQGRSEEMYAEMGLSPEHAKRRIDASTSVLTMAEAEIAKIEERLKAEEKGAKQ